MSASGPGLGAGTRLPPARGLLPTASCPPPPASTADRSSARGREHGGVSRGPPRMHGPACGSGCARKFRELDHRPDPAARWPGAPGPCRAPRSDSVAGRGSHGVATRSLVRRRRRGRLREQCDNELAKGIVPEVWAGLDIGKKHHHAVVIDADRKRLLSGRVMNDETELTIAASAPVCGSRSSRTTKHWAITTLHCSPRSTCARSRTSPPSPSSRPRPTPPCSGHRAYRRRSRGCGLG